MKRQYTVIVIPEEDGQGCMVMVPLLPGCFTQGPTIEIALERAKEAIGGFLKVLRMRDEEIPEEAAPLTVVRVEVEDVAESIAV